eukprot:TRINITY_DN71631_c0_g1_i1.p1 TRINITY_DN71631_c0_g1~~TRINITY_DN71631_c0_g1_i1.p1  ORF type:complete len:221 (-),score=36.11 TRINITY_DN71631_c0_g1_i1:385-1047(-)
MSDQGLVLQPNELRFQFVLNKQSPAQLSLYNPTTDRMAFKIKTTQPRRYSVRPSAGFVESGQTVEVRLTMQAQAETPVDMDNCRDKFLVQSVVVGLGDAEVLPEMFGKDRPGVVDAKLKVILEAPNGVGVQQTPETDQGVQQQVQQGTPVVGIRHDNGDISSLQRKIVELEKERNALKEKLQMFEKRGDSQGKNNAPKSQIRLIYLLIVAIVAFMIGHLL